MNRYKKATLLLILFSTVLRLFLGGSLEFGNDEVYYWLYAKYPDISHFDHPAMVGVFIQFFTANLAIDSELAIRLAAIIPTTVTMYIVYLIGARLKDTRTGFIATLLYNIHIYGFIIAGTFILPDAPLVLFWLLSFYLFIQVLPETPEKKLYMKLLLAFFFAGCAVYSKYQAVYLLFGVGLYVIFYNRKWLKKPMFYLGFIFPLLAVGVIFYWNYLNDFISYKFHGNRVSFFSFKFNKNSFLREIVGQFLYNNPYIVVMLILLFVAVRKRKFILEKNYIPLFVFCSLPLIFTTIYLSISRNTLPHWSGISYLTLLPLLAVYLSKREKITKGLLIGVSGFAILLLFASFSINTGLFLPENSSNTKEQLGRKDALMDLYGWKQASKKITKTLEEKKLTSLPIISNRWYPAAHIDYYIARPNQMKVYGVGGLNDIHKYYWINKNNPELGDQVLYITDSRNFKHPNDLYAENYTSIKEIEVIPIERGNKLVKYVFLYQLQK
ncbi:ArnT family glycosyltransferase [Tenacibaculum agarivorans]|uniref:ArnT family glycosyltransferase n=1 Tax=Tenacibaculum agarivorans TaxID=1908389 RepID=UPI000A706DD6|nr:glycosyltransferase family 39 protein [Tenacibaculum agarivorans]